MRMKKIFTLMLLFVLSTAVSFAQKTRQIESMARPVVLPQTQVFANGLFKDRIRRPNTRGLKDLVTPPSGVEAEVYYTVAGSFYIYGSSGWVDYTSRMPSVNVVVSDNKMYIQGLAYWFEDAWVEGTISGSTVTFACGQLLGEDEYGEEFLVGSDDGSNACDFVFTYDSEAGTLESQTRYILESGSATSLSIYTYWVSPTFSTTEPEQPEVVELPDGVEPVEYALTYTAYDGSQGSGSAAVAVDGDDVYFQGFSTYLPEAWIKGTKDGNTVTFPEEQYLGNYAGAYDSYFYGGTFTFNPDDDSYAAEGAVYSVIGGSSYDLYTVDPVLKKVVERAATPADPSISEIYASQYGDEVMFDVPVVDTDGEGLVASKLYFQFYIDIEKEISPLTFYAGDDFPYLDEDMDEIPYGFKDDDGEGYDFYPGEIFLNMDHDDWNRIGIKSIYYGGGEKHETEIQWFTIKAYSTLEENQRQGNWVASEQGYSNAQDVDGFDIDDNVSATCSLGTGANHPKYYSLGTALRLYGGNSLIISGGDDVQQIDQIVFNFSGTTYVVDFTVSEASAAPAQNGANRPAYAYSNSGLVGTWTGASKEVTFTNPNSSGHARIQSMDIIYTLKDNTTAITTIGADGKVVSEKYFDLQGRVATENTHGVLLKQTCDENGNVKTSKVIRK